MKKILLSLCLIYCLPSIALATVEFRFVTKASDGATEYPHDRVDQSYYLEDRVVMTVDDMDTIESVATSSGLPGIAIEFTESGQQRLSELSAENSGKTLAMLIEDQVVMLVPISQQINASRINFPIDTSMREVSQYVSMMNADKIESQRQQVVQNLTSEQEENVLSQRLNQQAANNNKPQVGIANKAEDFAKGLVGKKLLDFLLSNGVFILVGLVFILPILKKLFASIFSALLGLLKVDKSGAAQNLTKSLPLIISRNRTDESARDKGQRLLGDGNFIEAMKYLRPYCLQNPKDEQAKALLMNATAWSGVNQVSTKKSRRDDAHDARRRVEADRLRMGTSALDNAKQSVSSLKMDKTQALQMARSLLQKTK